MNDARMSQLECWVNEKQIWIYHIFPYRRTMPNRRLVRLYRLANVMIIIYLASVWSYKIMNDITATSSYHKPYIAVMFHVWSV